MADFKTRFSIGDSVYYVLSYTGSYMEEECTACGGEGYIMHNGHKFTCDECDGVGKKMKWHSGGFKVHKSVVGNIKIDSYESKTEIKYMLKATGVGSGTTWDESHIFATKEEAEKYIERQKNG